MRVLQEEVQFRRRSNASAIFLHIPYLNYLFPFFQLRGAYISIMNYFQFHRKIPNFFQSTLIGLKFSFYGSLGAILIYLILFLLGLSPFGKVVAFYHQEILYLFEGLLSPKKAVFLNAYLPQILQETRLSWEPIKWASIYILGSYLLFSFLGANFARYRLYLEAKKGFIRNLP